MKNVFLVAALSFGTMTAFAQVEEVAAEVATIEEVAVEAVNVEEVAVEAAAIEAIEAQDAFTEVAIEEVPEAITAALEVAHPGATISKAFINEAAQYKLEVTKEDGATAELYADAEGNWIEM